MTSYREKSLGGQFDDKLKFYFHAIQLCETEDKKINVLVKVTPCINLRQKHTLRIISCLNLMFKSHV